MWAGDGRICIWTSFTVQKSTTSEDCRQPHPQQRHPKLAGSLTQTTSVCLCVFHHTANILWQQSINRNIFKSRYRQRHRGLPSVFCSPKAVSKGGPNKPVVSSETGVCWLLRQKKQDNTEETVSSKQLQLQQSECSVSLHVVWSGCSSPFRSNLPNNITNVSFSKCGRSINNDRKNDGKS